MTGTPSQIEYYARALRAPRISDGFRRLGDQARDASWSPEEYRLFTVRGECSAVRDVHAAVLEALRNRIRVL
jgi:hypothetical protein